MHEMIHRTLATGFQRDRLAAARAVRMRRSLAPATRQGGPTRSGRVVIRLARALVRLGASAGT